MTPVLNTFVKQFSYSKFDPSNSEHMQAYLCLVDHGRQHPTLRFYLEEPFMDVPTLMRARIAEAYASKFDKISQKTSQLISSLKNKAVNMGSTVDTVG